MERHNRKRLRQQASRWAAIASLAGALSGSGPQGIAADHAPNPVSSTSASQSASIPKLQSPLPSHSAKSEDSTVTTLPIDLPTALELARASNSDIQMAVEKIREAQSNLSLARMQWAPSLQIGATYLHHDGRIQDIDGTIFDASKSSLFGGGLVSLQFQPLKVAIDVLKARQTASARSGELDRVTRATLQEVSLAYVDLVAAQVGASISLEITSLIEDLRDRAEKLEKEGVGTKVDLQRNRALLLSQLQRLSVAKQNQLGASARLAQLLNLQPGTRLVTAEDSLTPLTLVDENQDEETLLTAARNQGPGLTEVYALLEGLDQQERQLRRVAMFPNVNVDVGGGAFGGGFGGQLNDFNPASDYSVRMYWDVTKIIGTATTRELFNSKRRQASLQHEQIIGKLTLGVTVARDTAIKAHERIQSAESEIELAVAIYETSRNRLQAGEPTAAFEVQQAIATLGQARANYVAAVIEYNRAQIQLQYLVGLGSTPCVASQTTKGRHGKRHSAMPPLVTPGPKGLFGPPTMVPVHDASIEKQPAFRSPGPANSGPSSPGPALPMGSTGPSRGDVKAISTAASGPALPISSRLQSPANPPAAPQSGTPTKGNEVRRGSSKIVGELIEVIADP